MNINVLTNDTPPEHMSEVYYADDVDKTLRKSVFKLVWAELEDSCIGLTGEYLEYEDEDPGKGWAVTGMMKQEESGFGEWEFVQGDIIWFPADQVKELFND